MKRIVIQIIHRNAAICRAKRGFYQRFELLCILVVVDVVTFDELFVRGTHCRTGIRTQSIDFA